MSFEFVRWLVVVWLFPLGPSFAACILRMKLDKLQKMREKKENFQMKSVSSSIFFHCCCCAAEWRTHSITYGLRRRHYNHHRSCRCCHRLVMSTLNIFKFLCKHVKIHFRSATSISAFLWLPMQLVFAQSFVNYYYNFQENKKIFIFVTQKSEERKKKKEENFAFFPVRIASDCERK